MKISKIQIPQFVKTLAVVTPLVMASSFSKAQTVEQDSDIFVKSNKISLTDIPASRLESQPIKVGEERIYPAVLVDLSEGILYHYDLECYLIDAYPIASGKKSTPTKPGLRKISHIEQYPYDKAPKSTKRYKNPDDYGPYVVCLQNIDMKTGEVIGSDGQFIHGTNQPNSIGKKVSKGCVRLHNKDVEELVDNLYKNQYVLVQE